jgi:seryl-tRNA synthetase
MEGIKFENPNNFESDKSKNRKEFVGGEKDLVGNIEKGKGLKKRILYMGAVVILSGIAATGCLKKKSADEVVIDELKELSTKVELSEEEFDRKLKLEDTLEKVVIREAEKLLTQMEDLGNSFGDIQKDAEELSNTVDEFADSIANTADDVLDNMDKEDKEREEKEAEKLNKEMQELLGDKELNDILDSLK